ncbi:MAG: hypothetical protein JKY71_08295 [Alphaproteobacteria bacterium]|nr:hypothetical protein [Alphaproteobacteria bacterium]
MKTSDNKKQTDQEKDLRRKAREKLLKCKMYKWAAIILAFGAFVVTVNLNITLADGNSMVIARRPILIVIFLLPFVPPLFMGILSKRLYTQAMRDLEPLRNGKAQAR